MIIKTSELLYRFVSQFKEAKVKQHQDTPLYYPLTHIPLIVNVRDILRIWR